MDSTLTKEAARALEQLRQLLAIPSPTGYTEAISEHLLAVLAGYGFSPRRARKGTVTCALNAAGAEPRAAHSVLAAHVDTLGLMVREIDSQGRLRFTRLGGPSLPALETEEVTVYTRDGCAYTGVVQLRNASKHVNSKLETEPRDQDTMEILLDELADTREAVEALGVSVGDIVALEPRVRITASGFIRSRFLDDKLSAAMLLALAEAVSTGEVRLARQVTLLFSVYEEVGHGASSGVPTDAGDLLVVDMGCVGEGLACTETMVSICAKDSSGPFDYGFTSELIALAKKHGLRYAVDVYPFYGSDAATARNAGGDLRCALIGAGVYASHGYERSHVQGVENTLALMRAYLTE